MLLVFRHLRVGFPEKPPSIERLRSYFLQLKKRFPIVLPGDALSKRTISLCLTFDEPTYDFYHYVFPLLKEFHLRALLAVPVRYILDKAEVKPKERLAVSSTFTMQDGYFETHVPFCTFQELREMVATGLVEVASLSYSHPNLTFSFVNLEKEVAYSKEVLENKLSQAISSFVYPFGKVNLALQEYVSQVYPYAFGIGTALNWGWGKGVRPLCRMHVKSMYLERLLSPLQLAKYAFRSLLV